MYILNIVTVLRYICNIQEVKGGIHRQVITEHSVAMSYLIQPSIKQDKRMISEKV